MNGMKKTGLLSNYIYAVGSSEQDDNMYLGTNGKGVVIIQPDLDRFVHINSQNGLNNDLIWSILPSDNGTIWFGTYGGGLHRYKPGPFVNYNAGNGFPNDYGLVNT